MSAARKTIDVGLVGCGTRALRYGALFADIDPNAYARLAPAAYHHMTYYMHVEPQVPRVKGFRLAKVYDPDAEAARVTASALRNRPDVCGSIEEVSSGVDLVFVANDSKDGSNHRSLAEPGLRRGVPTFIDRPFAASVKDAKAMTRLAKRRGAPLLSCSHLPMLPQAERLKARFAEVGPIDQGVVVGSGSSPAFVADAVELALFLFGDAFKGRAASVQSMGASPLEVALIQFAKGNRSLPVLLLNTAMHASGAPPTFSARAASQFAPVNSPDLDAFAQTAGGVAVMETVKRMIATGESPLPFPALVEPVAVMEAARLSHNKTKAVPLADVR